MSIRTILKTRPHPFRPHYWFGLLLLAPFMAATAAEGDYKLHYKVELQPEQEAALVTIEIPDASLLRELDFNIDPNLHSDLEANGRLALQNGRAIWEPPEADARMTLSARITHQRGDGGFDALITPDWAIFRGDDLVPAARVRAEPGAQSVATLEFALPEGWSSVNTGWESAGDTRFIIDNPSRRFDRPTGWMIAGKLGTRRDQLGSTQVAVSAPKGAGLHRMDVLSFLSFVWPEVEQAFAEVPSELLLVGAGDPMWRGGLSAPNSLFLHSDRPLVSENGTSPLLHELVHMVTGIRGAKNHDWIAEGLAEFYSIELLFRAGGMTDARRDRVFRGLSTWGEDVKTLIKPNSTGKTTARATVLFDQLDQELRKHNHSLDAVTRELMTRDRASLNDLRRTYRELTGADSKVLNTALLQPPE